MPVKSQPVDDCVWAHGELKSFSSYQGTFVKNIVFFENPIKKTAMTGKIIMHLNLIIMMHLKVTEKMSN